MTGSIPTRMMFGPAGPQVDWVLSDGQPFLEPFFEETVWRLQQRQREARGVKQTTPAAALLEARGSGPPVALIFHVSRCGSTLMSQMLRALPGTVVISEAPVVDDILMAPRHDPRVTDEDRIAWLRGAINALGSIAPSEHAEQMGDVTAASGLSQRAGTSRSTFIKLHAWHIHELPLLRRAFPRTPFLFVHRHPLEVLVSLRRMPSLALVRGTVTPAQLGLTEAARDELTPEEHAAAVVGSFFQAACQHRAELIPVPYEAVAAFVADSMPGCCFAAEERDLLRVASQYDSKSAGAVFKPDAAAKRREASPAVVAASRRWAEPAYHRWSALSPTR